MRLDSAAMKALNVLESKTAGIGKRLLHLWRKQPLIDLSEIDTRLDSIQAFVVD